MSDFYRPQPAVISSFFFRHSATRAGGGGRALCLMWVAFLAEIETRPSEFYPFFSLCSEKGRRERESNFCVPCLISTNFPVGNKKPLPPLQRIFYFVALFRAQKLFSLSTSKTRSKEGTRSPCVGASFFYPFYFLLLFLWPLSCKHCLTEGKAFFSEQRT